MHPLISWLSRCKFYRKKLNSNLVWPPAYWGDWKKWTFYIKVKKIIKNIDEWNEHISWVLHHISSLYTWLWLKMPQTYTIIQSSEPYLLSFDSLFTWWDKYENTWKEILARRAIRSISSPSTWNAFQKTTVEQKHLTAQILEMPFSVCLNGRKDRRVKTIEPKNKFSILVLKRHQFKLCKHITRSLHSLWMCGMGLWTLNAKQSWFSYQKISTHRIDFKVTARCITC